MKLTYKDFIEKNIPLKKMLGGWRIEINSSGMLILNYTIINFDWKGLIDLDNDSFGKFITSESYIRMKDKLDRARKRFGGQIYFEAYSVSHLKDMLWKHDRGLEKLDDDKLLSSAIRYRSKQIKERQRKELNKENKN